MDKQEEKIRIDKWLWAARFFKTRNMASQAVNGGKVHLNGQRVKPSKTVLPGDVMNIGRNEITFEVKVLAVSGVRRPAVEARLLYQETAESEIARAKAAEMRRLVNAMQEAPQGKPNKRDRRKIKEFIRKG